MMRALQYTIATLLSQTSDHIPESLIGYSVARLVIRCTLIVLILLAQYFSNPPTSSAYRDDILSAEDLSYLAVSPSNLGFSSELSCDIRTAGMPAFFSRTMVRTRLNDDFVIVMLTQSDILSPDSLLNAFLRGHTISGRRGIEFHHPSPQPGFGDQAIGSIGFGKVGGDNYVASLIAWREGSIVALVSAEAFVDDILTAADLLVQPAVAQRDKLREKLALTDTGSASQTLSIRECHAGNRADWRVDNDYA